MNENQLPTPQEALQILDQATAKYNGSRSDHVKIQQSLEVLMQVVASVHMKSEESDQEPDATEEKTAEPELSSENKEKCSADCDQTEAKDGENDA